VRWAKLVEKAEDDGNFDKKCMKETKHIPECWEYRYGVGM
jgi:hypothetical protein